MTGGIALPILAPSTKANATVMLSALVLANVITSNTVARLECEAQAMMGANITARIRSASSEIKICWIIIERTLKVCCLEQILFGKV